MALALGLTLVFWWPLWLGAGFVGGDLYPYYFPQKQFLVDCLREGTLPLWNPLTGHGYPVLGESQTGAVYPIHLLCYGAAALGVWDLQTAWNVVLLAHYVLAFLAMWWCAQRCGLRTAGALLAGCVYVYGWFPARAALEWAILGGVYLPLTIGCVEAFAESHRARWLIALGLTLALQLLGGHYQIAFYTLLLLTAYIPTRLFLVRTDQATQNKRRALFDLCFLFAAVAAGIVIAGVQLLPTWELKQRSQRASVAAAHDPNYGHIPPAYLEQLVQPWKWYAAGRDLDSELQRMPSWAGSGTNRVEAHLYFGQIPLYLALGGLIALIVRRRWDGSVLLWTGVAVVSLVVATGTLQPVLSHVPGFSYFRGVGRIGVVTTLAVAFLAGGTLDRCLSVLSERWRMLAAIAVLAITIRDLVEWPSAINYAFVVPNPPIRARHESPLRELLLSESAPVRLYAPGANIANLLGVAATPQYLGLGPAEYFDPRYTLPPAETDDFHAFTPERQEWLRNAGVTHILSFEALEAGGWDADRVWMGFDPLLNAAWGRFREPLFLYRLRNAPGRAYWDGTGATTGIQSVFIEPHRIVIDVDAESPGRLVLTELAYPGWQAAIDDQTVPMEATGMFRAVDVPAGRHTIEWRYRPASVRWGLVMSLSGAFGLAALGWGACSSMAKTKIG